MQNLLNNTNDAWGLFLTIIAVVTIILWIFLPWVVMRIEGKVIKATQSLQDIRDILKDIKWELENHRPITPVEPDDDTPVDVEFTAHDEWRAQGFKQE